jgi:hypothetical protein
LGLGGGENTDGSEIPAAVPHDHAAHVLAKRAAPDTSLSATMNIGQDAINILNCWQKDLLITGIELIENETAIRGGEAVQSEDVLVLLQEPPYLGLLPAPALSQGFQSKKNSVFAVLANRSVIRKRISGIHGYGVQP